MRILFLDDDSARQKAFRLKCPPNYELIQVWNAPQALEALRGQRFDIIYLDHDLDGQVMCKSDENSGFAVAEAVAALPVEKQPRFCVVHSFNPDGANLMMHCLYRAKVRALRLLFGTEAFWNTIVVKKREQGSVL